MKFAMMIRDMLRSSAQKPVTERYPTDKPPTADNYRGLVYWDEERCTGCGLCVKDCPADAIELITIDKATKRFIMHYHADHCVYCGQCTYNCRFDCIKQSPDDWELARHDRSLYDIYYGRSEDIEAYLDNSTAPDAEPVAA